MTHEYSMIYRSLNRSMNLPVSKLTDWSVGHRRWPPQEGATMMKNHIKEQSIIQASLNCQFKDSRLLYTEYLKIKKETFQRKYRICDLENRY